MEKTIKTAYNKLGIRGIIRHIGQRVVNMEEIEERIKTTNYFLNHYCNIKDFPKAEGNLRLMQIGDSILLAIFDAVCKKHGFEYWIDSGTCLGAVRHKGFIPWDDDTDLCMMRDTYDNAKSVIKKELAIYGIDCDEFVPDVAFGVGYQHKDTGIWIDLLPAYYTTIDTTQSDERNLFLRRNDRYRYLWEKSKKRMNPEWTRKLRKKHFPEICTKENAKSIIDIIDLVGEIKAEVKVEADLIVLAVGQYPEVKGLGIDLVKGEVNEGRPYFTKDPKVFVCGDIAHSAYDKTVVGGVRTGKEVALYVHAALGGK